MLEHPIDTSPRQRIKSFYSRRGRITSAQQHALDNLWNRYGLDASLLYFDQMEHHPQGSIVVDIGFGNGESLIEYSKQHPEKVFIGVETYPPGVGHLLLALDKFNIENVKVYRDDAVDILENCFSDHIISVINLFFPDPWPKKRHHKRRLVNTEFVKLIATKLVEGGYFYSVTDCDDYARQIQDTVVRSKLFIDASDKPKAIDLVAGKPQTKFERKALQQGRRIRHLIFEKI